MRSIFAVALLTLLLQGCAIAPSGPTSDERQALASTGKFRLALLEGPSTRDPATGDVRGTGADIAKELARRLSVPFEPVYYRAVSDLVRSAPRGEWDAISVAINPDRLQVIDFSAPYSQVEMGVLAAKALPATSLSELDRAGVRVAVAERGDTDIILTKELKKAVLIRTKTFGEALELLRSGGADAASAVNTFLFPAIEKVPGSHMLAGRVGVLEIAIGVPKGRDAGVGYVRRVVDELKASGFVKASIDRAAISGIVPAP